MDENFSTKYTGEHGQFKFGVLATGSVRENSSWKSKPELKFGHGDTVTFIREGTRVNVQINHAFSEYYYDIKTEGDLYLSCSSYSGEDEFEIVS